MTPNPFQKGHVWKYPSQKAINMKTSPNHFVNLDHPLNSIVIPHFQEFQCTHMHTTFANSKTSESQNICKHIQTIANPVWPRFAPLALTLCEMSSSNAGAICKYRTHPLLTCDIRFDWIEMPSCYGFLFQKQLLASLLPALKHSRDKSTRVNSTTGEISTALVATTWHLGPILLYRLACRQKATVLSFYPAPMLFPHTESCPYLDCNQSRHVWKEMTSFHQIMTVWSQVCQILTKVPSPNDLCKLRLLE